MMVDKDAIAVFMPILAYETSKFRKQMTKVIETPLREIKEQEKGTESLLLQAYLRKESQSPMHCRRTLDQFSYYMLDTTESRDRDQVIYRWGRKKLKKEKKTGDAPLLMVDQLWFWVLQDGTLITSFPNTWDDESPYSLKTTLNQDMRNKEGNNKRKLIGSVDDLLHWIIRHSVDFLRREGPSDIKFQVAFQSSINNIADQEAEQFKSFKDITTTLNKKDLREEQKSEEIEKLFKLHVETRLLIEIKDIQDELNIVSSVLGQQKEILENLYKLCSPNENTGVDSNVTENSNPKTFSGVELIADNQIDEPDSRNKVNQKSVLHHDGLKEREKRKEKVKVHFPDERFKETEMDIPVLRNPSLIDDNLAIVKSNIRVVDDMIAYAKQVHTSITDLLDLKQRQANAWEARFSREGSQQSQRQGNIMLVFTLVTIVFVS
ncbi:hypothetical protein DL98DRAFT_93576 [Cadophora sp. DSE1049]|nr:hypothetical protein DL98DRAFT_93576 [Cadophora sp. DSE1049]